ncbi:hypothetical protein BaOVIS_010410 [Babesia ovis]|uniref:Uncharacterized protein n=1 Tax=Babesia ovis TaxID=5869 RepID=A0A9W5WUV5_BABOV|nr:hypothetical protein BaOVIS_010410 [Babesia ovis]
MSPNNSSSNSSIVSPPLPPLGMSFKSRSIKSTSAFDLGPIGSESCASSRSDANSSSILNSSSMLLMGSSTPGTSFVTGESTFASLGDAGFSSFTVFTSSADSTASSIVKSKSGEGKSES